MRSASALGAAVAAPLPLGDTAHGPLGSPLQCCLALRSRVPALLSMPRALHKVVPALENIVASVSSVLGFDVLVSHTPELQGVLVASWALPSHVRNDAAGLSPN